MFSKDLLQKIKKETTTRHMENTIIINGRIWMSLKMTSKHTINRHDCVLLLEVERVFPSENISYGFNKYKSKKPIYKIITVYISMENI